MANSRLFTLLGKGREVWNAWRLKNPDIDIDLSNADLEGADLAAFNLSGTILTSTNFRGANLEKANLENAMLWYANFENANLESANFRGASCLYSNFLGANLKKANLDYAFIYHTGYKDAIDQGKLLRILFEGREAWNRWRLEHPLTPVHFRNANLQGADLVGFDLSRATFEYTNLSAANLETANMEEADLRFVNLENANLRLVNLTRASCLHANFTGADLQETSLENLIVRGPGLSDTSMQVADDKLLQLLGEGSEVWNQWRMENPAARIAMRSANLQGVNLQGFNFSGADFGEASFRGANLEGCNFAGAYLWYTNFERANLKAANLSRASCRQANFQETNLERANLEYAMVADANFIHANVLGANVFGIGPGASAKKAAKKLIEKSAPGIKKRIPKKAGSKKLMTLATRKRKGKTDDGHNLLKCTVFAPSSSSPGKHIMVQVFAFPESEEKVVQKLAKLFDASAKVRGEKLLNKEVEQGSEVTFELVVAGFVIKEPFQSIIWRGKAESVQFGVFIPKGHPYDNVIGTVYISQNSMPAGHIKFILKVEAPDGGLKRSNTRSKAQGQCLPYKYAFISYASVDRNEVLKRVQMLPYYDTEFFQDVLSLEPGERWEKALYKNIDMADVFLLFWSKAAKESEWVMKEVKYAMQANDGTITGKPEIRPVIIEVPPPRPPRALKNLHFNDRISQWFGK